MTIALDYDGTYTRDPEFWHEFATLAKSYGHLVGIVTARPECCPVELLESESYLPVTYTSGAKKSLVAKPDVWIDDWPEGI